MKRFFLIAFFVLLACSKDNGTTPETIQVTVTCVTAEASSVSETSATLNGEAAIKGAVSGSCQACFYYSTTQADATTLRSGGLCLSAGRIPSAGGKFSASVDNLSEATTYWFTASVSIDGKEELGRVKSFTTKGTKVSVTTNAATCVSEFRATMNGTLSVSGTGSSSTQVWFLYSSQEQTIDKLELDGIRIEAVLGGDGKFSVSDIPLSYDTKYYCLACALAGDRTYHGEVISFSTKSCPEELIDLGLSVKWRSWNTGALKPEEYGAHFAWGDVTGQTWNGFSWSTGGFHNNPDFALGNKGNLKSEYDAAHVLLGGKWRMPTKTEMEELTQNCTLTKATVNGINGMLFTSLKEGYTDKSIFLPAAGEGALDQYLDGGSACYYWTGTYEKNDGGNWSWMFTNCNDVTSIQHRRTYWGLSVRPVYGESEGVDIETDISGWDSGEDIIFN